MKVTTLNRINRELSEKKSAKNKNIDKVKDQVKESNSKLDILKGEMSNAETLGDFDRYKSLYSDAAHILEEIKNAETFISNAQNQPIITPEEKKEYRAELFKEYTLLLTSFEKDVADLVNQMQEKINDFEKVYKEYYKTDVEICVAENRFSKDATSGKIHVSNSKSKIWNEKFLIQVKQLFSRL